MKLTVLLFDDLLNTGHSMNQMADQLRHLGTTVFGGITIGRSASELP